MTKAAKKSPLQPLPASNGVRVLRSKGPLSPRETEIVIYAGLANGQLTETPGNLAIKSKAITHLATDRPSLASAIAHKRLLQGAKDVPVALQISRLAMELTDHNEREAAVAGSLELIDTLLKDAIRIHLFTDEAKPVIPAMFDGWKISKPDNRSTPPVITLSRD